MPSDWPYIRIGDLVASGDASIQTGPFGSQLHKHDYVERGVAIIPTEAIGRGAIRLDAVLPQISESKASELRRHKLLRGDILFARRGVQATGLSAIVGDAHGGALCGTGAILLRVNHDVMDPQFLAGVLATDETYHWLRAHAVGAVMPNLNTDIISQLTVPMPKLKEQRSIASTIQALSQRIDLLHQTSATLESIAQALFKSWFVDFDPVRAKVEGREPEGMDAATAALFPTDFEESSLGLIPKGWSLGKFGELAALAKGSVSPLEFPTIRFELYSLPAFDAGQLPILEMGKNIKSNKTRVAPGAVLQSKLNPHIPRVWFTSEVGEHAACSTEFLPWLAKPQSSPELVYCVLRSSAFEAQVHTLVTGTSNSHQRVKPDQVAALRIVLPAEAVRARFADLTRPMLCKVSANRVWASKLAELRDSLLPRLISGKLRLPCAQAQLEDALA